MKKLTDICDIQYGYAFDSKCFTEDPLYPALVRIRDVKRGYSETYYSGDYPEEYLITSGDLLIGMDGEFNIARWKSDRALLNQRVCKLTAKKGTNEEYIRFAMSKVLKEIEHKTAFVTVKHLSAKELNKLYLNVPELSEQNKIAEMLSRLEKIIDMRRQELEKLDELIQARFVEMFGDPVENPYNWPVDNLTNFGECKNGMNFHTDDSGVEIHCLGVGDFKNLSLIEDTSKLPTISLNEMPSDDYLLTNGDIVFVRSNGNKALVGRSVVVYPDNIPTTFSGFCIRFRIQNPVILPSYLLRVLKTDSMRKKMEGRGANIQNLNQKILATLRIPIPALVLQEEFEFFVKKVDKSKLVIQKALNETQLLFESLLQEYFK